MNLMTVMMASGYGPFGSGTLPMAGSATSRESRAGESFSESLEKVLGKDAFLQLLVTQLRYQDPIKPVDDQDFIAQMAQFSALEQTQNLTKAMEAFVAEQREANQMARAMQLLGRVVEVAGSSGARIGTVEGIRMQDGVPNLIVGGAAYSLSEVVQVLAG